MARGRLINPFLAELWRLDTSSTSDQNQPTGGFDDDFREVRRVADGSWQGSSQRQEASSVKVKCQLEITQFSALQALLSGHDKHYELALVFHFRDLENAGLVESATKNSMIKVNARLSAIYRMDGTLEQTMPDLYAVEAQPAGFGMGRRRNLLLVTFKDRTTSVRG